MNLRVFPGTSIPAASAAKNRSIGPTRYLDIDQEVINWCWAACVQMVYEGDGRGTLHQCELAQHQFGSGSVNCCPMTGLPPLKCQQPLPPDRVKDVWGDRGYKEVQGPTSRLSVGDLRRELGARPKGRPVEAWLGQAGASLTQGSGHVLLVVGSYDSGEAGGEPWLIIRDPNPVQGKSAFSYQDVIDGKIGYGPWIGSWTGIS